MPDSAEFLLFAKEVKELYQLSNLTTNHSTDPVRPSSPPADSRLKCKKISPAHSTLPATSATALHHARQFPHRRAYFTDRKRTHFHRRTNIHQLFPPNPSHPINNSNVRGSLSVDGDTSEMYVKPSRSSLIFHSTTASYQTMRGKGENSYQNSK